MTRRRELLAGGALVLAAVLGWALVRTYPGYGSYFALLWGREIRHGFGPAYEVYAAPTPHPLWTATGALAGLFGRHGDRVLILVTVLSWAALGVGHRADRLGAVGRRARPARRALPRHELRPSCLYAGKAFVDVPFVALVVWAGVLEAERPRRGRPVALLLALAGPAASRGADLVLPATSPGCGGPTGGSIPWSPRSASAPRCCGSCSTPLVTGDPLFSLHQTSFVVDSIGEDVPVWRVPDRLVSFLGL